MNPKNSVADQPGLFLSLSGLFLALFVGLGVRALIAPEKVRDHLVRATAGIHRDFKFEFKDAYVTLSRGVLPDLSVIIKDVTIQSEKACWLSPLAEVNQIRLPLSWRELFSGNVTVEEILADEVNMSFRSVFKSCDETVRSTASEPSSHPPPPTPTPTPTPIAAAQAIQSTTQAFESTPLKTLEISSLKIHYLPVAFTSFEIKDFQVRLKSENPKIVEAEGRLSLGGETLVGDYSSHAELFFHWEEGPQPKFLGTAKGLWREGHYDLLLEVRPQSQDFSLSTDIRHLPLSQVIPVLKKYRWMESEFNGKQAWFSGRLKMAGKTTQLQQTPVEMQDLKLEGNLGEISSASVLIESLDPLKYPPVDLQIRGLNLQEFLIFLGKTHPSQALANLGVFNGVSQIVGPNHVKLSGDFSGLEFIFANRGARQIQTLSLLSGELEFKNNRWNVVIDRIKPHQGIFDGKVTIQADRDFKEMDLNLKLEEMTLSPDVQSLMTAGGSIGPMRGQILTKLNHGEISGLQGNLRFDQILVDGISLYQPRMGLRTQGSDVVANINVQSLDFLPDNPMLQSSLAPLLEGVTISAQRMLLKNLSTEIQTDKFTKFSWKNLSVQSERGTLRSSGSWDEKGKLSGDFSLANRRWELGGYRSSPVWTRREK